MKSNGRSPDFDLVRDLPTTSEDAAALRRISPEAPADWLERLTELSDPALFPSVNRDRATSAGWPPFEL